MPTFFIIEGVKIELFYNDHDPPHFHASIAEFEALIAIEDQKMLQGSLPKRKKKRIKQWAKENRATLAEIWESLRNR